MFDSDRTWFCKQLKTEDAKRISEDLNSAINRNNHAEATQLFQKVKKYMKKRIDENYFPQLKESICVYQSLLFQKILHSLL